MNFQTRFSRKRSPIWSNFILRFRFICASRITFFLLHRDFLCLFNNNGDVPFVCYDIHITIGHDKRNNKHTSVDNYCYIFFVWKRTGKSHFLLDELPNVIFRYLSDWRSKPQWDSDYSSLPNISDGNVPNVMRCYMYVCVIILRFSMTSIQWP